MSLISLDVHQAIRAKLYSANTPLYHSEYVKQHRHGAFLHAAKHHLVQREATGWHRASPVQGTTLMLGL